METGVHRRDRGSSVALESHLKKGPLVSRESEQGRKKSDAYGKRRRWQDTLSGYLFISPAIVGFMVFVFYPLIASAYYALTRWDGVTNPVFIGFKNFTYIFTKDPSFLPTLKATGLFALLSVPSSLIFGLLLAVLLNRSLPGIRLFRTALYLPAVLPSIATLTLWKFIYNPQFGLANQFLTWLHLPTSTWLSSYTMAMPSIVIVGLWGIGSTMIIFLAGLQAVPQEIYEAAKMDGAGFFTLFLRTTLPMISPILFLQLVLQIIAALQAFNQFRILTVAGSGGGDSGGGGPGFTTEVLMLHIYQSGFGSISNFPQLGYAIAEVWILFFFILVVTISTFRFSSMWVYQDSNLD